MKPWSIETYTLRLELELCINKAGKCESDNRRERVKFNITGNNKHSSLKFYSNGGVELS